MVNVINIIKLADKHKGYIFFTFFKYLEYGILAFIFMSFANLVSPEEYGKASLGFQTITYSSFIVLGINQVLLKKYTLEKQTVVKSFLLQYNVLYNFSFAILVIALVHFSIYREYSHYLGLICGAKLILESSIAVNRVKGSIKKINVIYLSVALAFCILYFSLVKDSYSFFQYWSYSVVFGVLVAFFLTLKVVFSKFDYLTFKENFKKYRHTLFRDGLKLSLIAVISPLFSTIGIILLNFISQDKALIGNFQLADNISNMIALSGASVIFIIFPDAIKKIDNNKNYIKKMYKLGFKCLLIVIPTLIILYYPLQKIIPYFFPEYFDLAFILIFSIILRLLVLFIFIPTVVFITFSLEKTFIKVSFIFVLIEAILIYILISYGNSSLILNYLIPLQILMIIAMQIIMRKIVLSRILTSK